MYHRPQHPLDCAIALPIRQMTTSMARGVPALVAAFLALAITAAAQDSSTNPGLISGRFQEELPWGPQQCIRG